MPVVVDPTRERLLVADLNGIRALQGADGGPSTPPTGAVGVVADASGGVQTFGSMCHTGDARTFPLTRPVVDIALTPTDRGYWLVAADGGIFAFGDAGFRGSTGAITLNQPIVGMATTPTGAGYWLVAADGGIFAFGDAGFHGSTGAMVLNQPIVGMATTPTGAGYWLVAADGGIFAFGDAGFHGSAAELRLNQPVRSIAATSSGGGYWFSASDGGVFSYGDATFLGRLPLTQGSTLTAAGSSGYWLTPAELPFRQRWLTTIYLKAFTTFGAAPSLEPTSAPVGPTVVGADARQ
jgi:hypothetical protein